MVAAVVGHRSAVGRHCGVGLGDVQAAGHRAHGVVGLSACGHGIGIAACILGGGACGQDVAQVGHGVAALQACHREATDRLVRTVVGHGAAVAGGGQGGLGNAQAARHGADGVVGLGACGHGIGIAACVLSCGACGHYIAQVSHRVAALKACDREATDRLVGAVVVHSAAVAGGGQSRLGNVQAAVHETQVVVAVCAVGRYRIASRVFLSEACTHARQHGCRLATHQAGCREAADALITAVVGHRSAVGRHRGVGLGNVQAAGQGAHGVVGLCACCHCVGIVTRVLGGGAGGHHVAQVGHRVTSLQASHRKAADRLVGAGVGHGAAVASSGQGGLGNVKAAGHKRQVVVAVSSTGCHRIAARVFGGARCAHTGENGCRLAADQAGSGKATDALVAAVVSHRSAVGRHCGVGLGDVQTAVHKTEVVVAVCAAGGHHIAARVLGSAACAHAGEHGRGLAAYQAGGGEAAHALVTAVVSHRSAVGRHRGVGLGNVQAAGHGAHGVVGLCACRHGIGIAASVLGGGACGHHIAQVGHGVTALQACHREAADRLVRSVVGHGAAVAGGG